MIASKKGRGYHRSGPTGYPDHSGLHKLGEPAGDCQSDFSMTHCIIIGGFGLTRKPAAGIAAQPV